MKSCVSRTFLAQRWKQREDRRGIHYGSSLREQDENWSEDVIAAMQAAGVDLYQQC